MLLEFGKSSGQSPLSRQVSRSRGVASRLAGEPTGAVSRNPRKTSPPRSQRAQRNSFSKNKKAFTTEATEPLFFPLFLCVLCSANVELRRSTRRFSRKFQMTNPKTQTIMKSQIQNRKLKTSLFGNWSFGFGPGTPGWVLGFGISIAGTNFGWGTGALCSLG